MIVIVAYAALKLSELSELQVKDIDLNNNLIKIRGNKQRAIHISKELIILLKNYIAKKQECDDCEYLFISRQNNDFV